MKAKPLSLIDYADRLLDVLCPDGHLLAIVVRPPKADDVPVDLPGKTRRRLLVYGQGSAAPSVLWHLDSSGLCPVTNFTAEPGARNLQSLRPGMAEAERCCPTCHRLCVLDAEVLRRALPATGERDKRQIHVGAAVIAGTAHCD